MYQTSKPLTERAMAFQLRKPLLARLRNSTFPESQNKMILKVRASLPEALPLVANQEYHGASILAVNESHRRSFSGRVPALAH